MARGERRARGREGFEARGDAGTGAGKGIGRGMRLWRRS